MSQEQLDNLRAMLKGASGGAPPTLAELRAGAEQLYSGFAPPREIVFDELSVPRSERAALRLHQGVARTGEKGRVVLYFHGGGFVAGSAASFRGLAGTLASAAGLDVMVVDYQLAPENPYPAATEDAIDAYEWLLTRLPPEHVVVAGDSAGAALALYVLQEARRRGRPGPAAAVFFSPWVDLGLSGASIETKGDADVFLQPEMLQMLASHYCADRDVSAAEISPLFSTMAGLPPILIQVGSDEILLDDAVRLASRCGAAGVSTRLEVWPGMPHVWHAFAPVLDEGQQAIAKAGAFIRELLP